MPGKKKLSFSLLIVGLITFTIGMIQLQNKIQGDGFAGLLVLSTIMIGVGSYWAGSQRLKSPGRLTLDFRKKVNPN